MGNFDSIKSANLSINDVNGKFKMGEYSDSYEDINSTFASEFFPF